MTGSGPSRRAGTAMVAGDGGGLVAWVNGRTRLFGVIGHPIEQVRSPERVSTVLQRRGINAILLPMHVLPAQFDMTMAGLMAMPNVDGFVVTVPYKAKALELAGRLGPHGRRVGAINALVRSGPGDWVGEMFDGLGCVDGLLAHGVTLAGARVQLLGAGGAGRAIAVAVADQGPASIRIHDPDQARADELAGILRASAAAAGHAIQVDCGELLIDRTDLLLNASSVGMLDDARLPIPATRLPASLTVFDAIVQPEITPLIAQARACGCRTVTGLAMLDAQIERLTDFLMTRSA